MRALSPSVAPSAWSISNVELRGDVPTRRRQAGASMLLPRSRMTDVPSKNTGVHLWLVLMKAHRALSRHASKSIEPSGLGQSDFAVLEVLLSKGPQKVNDIGRRVDLTSGSITTAIDRLEARGLVAREHDDADRRARVVRLTPAGRAHIGGIFLMQRYFREATMSQATTSGRDTCTRRVGLV
jgi:MarR family transcriptional regulator, 2-MHQ and catechol-resistance regulon repressor